MCWLVGWLVGYSIGTIAYSFHRNMSMTVQAVRIQLFIRVLTVSILNGLVGWLAVVGYSIGTIACSFHRNVNDSTVT